jgi:hypothetical protein
MLEPFMVLFPLIPPPKLESKGARFLDFRCYRVRCVLVGISFIPLVLVSFGGPNSCINLR